MTERVVYLLQRIPRACAADPDGWEDYGESHPTPEWKLAALEYNEATFAAWRWRVIRRTIRDEVLA
jgi:hypothetical protein